MINRIYISQKFPSIILIFIVAFIGIMLNLVSTQYGAGIFDDSVDYIGAARNLLHTGQLVVLGEMKDSGMLVPSVHFSPLYSVILAILGYLFSIDPWIAARGFDAFLFGLNIGLVGLMIYMITDGSVGFSLLGSILFLSHPTIFTLHVRAMSEPLFYALLMVTAICFARYLENQKKALLFIAGATTAMACLTRYIGMTILITGMMGIAFLSSSRIKDRISNIAFFMIIGGTPLAFWYLRNYLLVGAISNPNRIFMLHPISRQAILEGINNMSRWVGLDIIPFWGKLIFLLLVGIILSICIFAVRREKPFDISKATRKNLNAKPILLSLIFIGIYLSFLVISISFMDQFTQLDQRILSPVFICGIMITLYTFPFIWLSLQRKLIPKLVIVSLCLILVTAYLWKVSNTIQDFIKDGQGFASLKWQQSEGLVQIKNLPSESPIFSNVPDAIYIITGRVTSYLPLKINYYTGQPNLDYSRELKYFREYMELKDGVLVFFTDYPSRLTMLTLEEIEQIIPLRLTIELSDSKFFSVKKDE